jgi:hypothetical protein
MYMKDCGVTMAQDRSDYGVMFCSTLQCNVHNSSGILKLLTTSTNVEVFGDFGATMKQTWKTGRLLWNSDL